MKTILTVIIVAVLTFAFGCKEAEKQSPAPKKTTAQVQQQQVEKEITKENMDEQLKKVEKEIKADVNAK